MESKIEKLCRFASMYFKVEETRLYGKSTDNESVIARYCIWFYLHVEKEVSAGVLAKSFFRDRRAIFKGISKMKILIKRSKCYRDMYTMFIEEYNKKATL